MKHIYFLIITFFLSAMVHAQEVIATAGKNSESISASMSWTIGETITETYIGANNILTQGVQQPKLTITDESPGSYYKITAFPNPVHDLMNIKIEADQIEGFWYILYDFEGRIIKKEPIEEKEITIETKSLTPSSYVLKVTDNKKILKSFKIVKQ